MKKVGWTRNVERLGVPTNTFKIIVENLIHIICETLVFQKKNIKIYFTKVSEYVELF